MRVNWGTGIVLAFIGFIAFIMYFVINMNTDKTLNHHLVTEDYYKEELKFQKVIDKEKNSKKLTENISWKKTEEGLLLSFPKDLQEDNIKGKVFLYRPSNKLFDFEVPINLSNHNLLIPNTRLLDGRWNIAVDWEYNNVGYLYKEEIVY